MFSSKWLMKSFRVVGILSPRYVLWWFTFEEVGGIVVGKKNERTHRNVHFVAHWFSYSGLAHRLNRKSYSSLTWSSPFGFWLSGHQLSLLFSKMYVTILHVGFWLSTYQMSLLFNFQRHGDPYEKSYLLCNSRFFEVEYIIFSCRT